MTTDFTDDLQLGELLRAEVPSPADGYWTTIHGSIASATAVDTDVPRAQSIDVVEADDDAASFPTRIRRGFGGAAALAIAAALLLIVGLLVGTRLRSSENVDVGFAGRTIDGYTVAAGNGNGPRQNLDHWHAVYGVWDCTANDGQGGWLEQFDSTEDDVGIHSHDDGMIYIHPFFEESAEENATFSHFADSMNFELTDESLTLPDGRALLEGTSCGGEPTTLHLRRWSTDLAARSQQVLAPQIITEKLGAERFNNDREVWILAFAPLDADIPLPPAERFAELDNWFAMGEQAPAVDAYTMRVLDADTSQLLVAPPPAVTKLPSNEPTTVFSTLTREPRPGWTDLIVDATFRPIAMSAAVADRDIVLASYRIELGDGASHRCVAAIDMITRRPQGPTHCNALGPSALLQVAEHDDHVFLRDVPTTASFVVIELDDGERIVANVVEQYAYLGGDFSSRPIATIELYTDALQRITE